MRDYFRLASQVDNKTARVIGLVSVFSGLTLLYYVRH